MGGRYLITGVQLAMLIGSVATGKPKKFHSLVEKVLGNQYLFDSEDSVIEDVEAIREKNEGNKKNKTT